MLRTVMNLLASAVAFCAVVPAIADERFPPVADPVVKAECGACHMPFQPQMLPRRSWEAILTGLDKHFGEDASLPAAKVTAIRAYLAANAADMGGGREGVKFLRDLPASATPLRVTEMPRWVREHRRVRPETWVQPAIGSKANCQACHTTAEGGDYGDRALRIPR